MKEMQCNSCGHTYQVFGLPSVDFCPICGQTNAAKFVALDQVFYRGRPAICRMNPYINDLGARVVLIGLVNEIEEIVVPVSELVKAEY